jgi:GT2 family glycosyltransferase
MTEHYNIVVATPGTMLTAGYVKSLVETFDAIRNQGLTCMWLNAGGSHVGVTRERTVCGTDYANNRIAKVMNGAFTYDKLFWIDSDISWKISDFAKLSNSDLDIVSGAYMMADHVVVLSRQSWGGLMPYEEFVTYTEPFSVASVGFGFLCMKAGVMESLPKPWFGAVPENDRFLVGEDISWCLKARRAGYEIIVDPSVRVDHCKSIIVDWPSEPAVEVVPAEPGHVPAEVLVDVFPLGAGDPQPVPDDADGL